MGLYTHLVANGLFPLHERLKHHGSVAVRKAMEASQWWSPDRLETFRVDRLKAFLSDVQAHSPYYAAMFARSGFEPQSLTSLSELQRLPLLTKADIRGHVDAIRADDAGALSRFNTGGSSGEPLIFFLGKERVSHDVAAKWRATRWWGVDIGDPEIVVWGSPIELGAQDRIKAVRDALLRTEILPAFDMSAARLDHFVDRICARRPKMLFGYPSAISLIAAHAQKKGIALDGLGIKVVFVTSERLYDHQRELIETAFGCPVANGYGSRDAGFIAHQCPHGGMHITAEDIVVEIVDPAGRPLPAGEAGEIVVTHMATRDFPFIRYRTGDMAVMDDAPCACGRGLPVLREIQGRSTDFVVAQDGTVMHGLSLIYVLRDYPGISAFKIVQDSRDQTTVQVVVDDGVDMVGLRETVSAGLRARLGESVDIHIQAVDEIPAEASGKYRYVISKVDPMDPMGAA